VKEGLNLNSLTLDTDIVIELLRGNDIVKRKMEQLPKDTLIHITGLTVYELYKGVSYIGSKKLENDLEKFIRRLKFFSLIRILRRKPGKSMHPLRKKGKINIVL
jgi:predicted nucleic acid-binding protein